MEATKLAVDVLRDGGNAFDAAFMLAFALAVCHPQAGNLGGGGYLVFKRESEGEPVVFNYREQSPVAATMQAFLSAEGEADPERTAFGPSSACVPGTVRAFFTLQARYGVLNPRNLLSALAELARNGCRMTSYQAQCLNRLAPKLSASPESRDIFVKEEGTFQAGDVLRNPHLGDTFETLAQEGAGAFYAGVIAERIEESLVSHGGFMTVDDLMRYEIRVVKPISTELGGYRIWTVPPEGGGALLLEILNILNRREFLDLEPYTPEFYHYLSQAAKITFIDRTMYMGDGNYENIAEYASIFDPGFMQNRFASIEKNRDIPTDEYVSKLYGRGFSGMGTTSSGTQTTHFSITDSEGNAVSNSYTLNLRYGSKWSVERTGILMNGSVDSFAFVPGKPNYFGVMGNEMNLFAPNKRPASNMAPVMVTKNGKVHFLIGSPGGPTIPTSLAAILFSVLVHGIDPAQSIMEGRVHHQAWPDVLYRERDEATIPILAKLQLKGYNIEERKEPIGDMQAIIRGEENYVAISDFRREGGAASYSKT
jgi:gamma-glutamyltranspeptidase/glutathione hydrolase